MHHSHQLDKQTHQDFLLQQRVDPITGELIEAGHKIVICSVCKSAFFEESWEYLEGKHCEQTDTLPKIPIAQTLWLKAKPLEFLPFDFEGFDKRFHYQDMAYNSLKFIVTLFYYVFSMLGFYAFDEKEYEILTVLVLGAVVSFFLSFNVKKAIKKLPSLVNKHLLPINREHKLAIDNKKQMLIFRNDFKEMELLLEGIHNLNYSFNYVEEDASRYKDMCQLIVTLGFYKNGVYKTRIITTYFRKIYFHKWEEFLNKLPTVIEITVSRIRK